MPNVILASGSPRRREILASLGVTFTVVKPDIDETQRPGENPYAYVARLSQEKADAVAARLEGDNMVLAADTVVVVAADTIGVVHDGDTIDAVHDGDTIDAVHDGDILGKPVDDADARAMLERLRGVMHVVCTAITLLKVEGAARQRRTELTRTRVIMREYSDDEITAYIATGDPFDKAGGYAIQHEQFAPVAQIDGSYSNVVGLPVETLQAMLIEMGIPAG